MYYESEGGMVPIRWTPPEVGETKGCTGSTTVTGLQVQEVLEQVRRLELWYSPT